LSRFVLRFRFSVTKRNRAVRLFVPLAKATRRTKLRPRHKRKVFSMKAYEIQAKSGLDSLTLADRPDLDPASLKPGEVLIKVRAVSLNYRDLLIAKNAYGAGNAKAAPFIPVSDGAGEVVAVGADVARVRVGDRVAGAFFQGWIDGAHPSAANAQTALGAAGVNGMLASYVVLHENGVTPVPAYLTDEEAASLPCAAVTAWNALFEEGKLTAGQTVLLQGTGGVSLFALQLARAAGARVIITSSSDDKLARAKSLGAHEGVNYVTTPQWDEAAFALTNGQGVDYVVEVGGPQTLNQSLRAARYGGTISVIGVLSGFAGEVSTATILQKNLRLQGIYVGSRAMFENLNRALEASQNFPVRGRPRRLRVSGKRQTFR